MSTEQTPRLHVTPERVDSAFVLAVRGDLDAANSQILRDHLVASIEGEGRVLVLDLADVDYIDSVGLGTLVSGLKRATERNTQLRLVCTKPQIHKVLSITGLIRVFEVYGDRAAALAGGGAGTT
jgi:anti-sigma B factor antagonist